MDSPKNNIWGPALWALLHHSTEQIGVPQKRLPEEESRIWTNVLSSLRFSLPCPQCKKHYSEYIKLHPIPLVNKNNIRNWLYTLHCNVNTRLNKENDLTIEQLSEIYCKPFHFTNYYKIVAQHMIYSLRLGWCIRTDIQNTFRALEELKRFYNFV
jgi:hypothetical protein